MKNFTDTKNIDGASLMGLDSSGAPGFFEADPFLDRISAVETGQASAVVGYDTQANLYADLAHAAGEVAYVTNDPTASKNGTYRKIGASGSGSWAQSSYDRVAALERKITNDFRMAQVSGNNLIDLENDILYEYSLNPTTGELSERAWCSCLAPIPVTPGVTYTLSGRAAAWPNGRTHCFINYTGTTPRDLADVLANSTTVLADTSIYNGMLLAPAGANYLIIGIDWSYGKSPAEIKAAMPNLKLEIGSVPTLDSSFAKGAPWVTEREFAGLGDIASYKNLNWNYGLNYLSGIESMDFNLVDEYRHKLSRDCYDFTTDEDDDYLVSLGIKRQFGFQSGADYFLGADGVTHYRRMSLRFIMPSPLKLIHPGYNTIHSTCFIKYDGSDDIAFFMGMAGWIQLITADGVSYETESYLEEPDQISTIPSATYAETEMIIGKQYRLSCSDIINTITKVKDGLYRVNSQARYYVASTTTTKYITEIHIGQPKNAAITNITDKFLISGCYFYQPSAEEIYTPISISLEPPAIFSPVINGVKTIGENAARAQESLGVVETNGWKGKKILWLGTSVPNEPPYGEPGTLQYPQFVGQILKADVTVRARGGSIVAWDPANSRYGLAGSAAEFVSAGHAEDAYSIAWDTALTGHWDSDLIVFDHGHNDAGLMGDYINDGVLDPIDETNAFDRKWMVGGMNYVIREIYKRNPRAKILIINDYRAEYVITKDANQMVADWWGLPIFNPRMSAKNIDIVIDDDTTYQKYDGTTGTISAGATINPLKYFTKASPDDPTPSASDLIHPGRYGRIMYAKGVAQFIKSNVISSDTDGFY